MWYEWRNGEGWLVLHQIDIGSHRGHQQYDDDDDDGDGDDDDDDDGVYYDEWGWLQQRGWNKIFRATHNFMIAIAIVIIIVNLIFIVTIIAIIINVT